MRLDELGLDAERLEESLDDVSQLERRPAELEERAARNWAA